MSRVRMPPCRFLSRCVCVCVCCVCVTQQVLLYHILPYIVCVCVYNKHNIFLNKKAANWLSRTISDNLGVSSDQSSLLRVEHALHDAGCCALFSPHLPTDARVIYAHTHTHKHAHTHIWMCVCGCVYMYIYIHTYIHKCIYSNIHTYTYIHV